MKRQLVFYIIRLVLGIVILGIGWLVITNLLIYSNIVIPANYSESILNENKVKLSNLDKITSDYLPKGCEFVVFNHDNNKKYGNMSPTNLEHALGVVAGTESNVQGNTIYSLIDRNNEVCVVKYNMRAYFNFENEKFCLLNYDFVSYSVTAIVYILYVYIITLKLVNSWKHEFAKIERISLEIENGNLDFEMHKSNIKEFSHTIDSMIRMREALKETLYLNWKIENEKNEEIGALAHDIKIPLTVIKGNTELVLDYDTKPYNVSHLQNVMEAAEKIEKYLTILIQYIKVDKIESGIKEKIECDIFSERIKSEAEEYVANQDTKIDFSINHIAGRIYLDSFSMERAIFNIIDNAIEYKTEKDTILCNIMQEKDLYTIAISNKYGKFNDEVLVNATKLFYTSNKHRSTAHYGIGLAYVNRVIKANKCYLCLFNSDELGATVKIQAPILYE